MKPPKIPCDSEEHVQFRKEIVENEDLSNGKLNSKNGSNFTHKITTYELATAKAIVM